jgi:predicted DNA-binding WGR domain protein
MATAAHSGHSRPADTAGLEVALVERALSDGGLLFSRVAPGIQCFYRLTLQPTLFGGLDMVREWGRVGPSPPATRRLVERYAGQDEAVASLGRSVRVRLRHGYRARALPARFVPSAPAVLWCPRPAQPVR